jgi:hypothetical protein
LISTEGLKLLRNHNIHVFEVDRLIGKKFFDFKNRLFYELKANFTRFLRNIPEPNFQTTLTEPLFFLDKVNLINLVRSDSLTNRHSDDNISIPKQLTIKQHDTPSLETTRNLAFKLLEAIKKQRELREKTLLGVYARQFKLKIHA